MVDSEKNFKRCPKLSANRSRLLDRFKEKRDIFDKALRNAERYYNRKFADKIEEINTSDPNIFWDYIRKLGPRQSRDIPTKVYGDDNTLCDDPDIVLHKWKSEFEALYNIPDSQNDKFDDTFLVDKIAEKCALEAENDTATEQTEPFNSYFSMDELLKVCNKCKNGKSVGPDLLPNEILKMSSLHLILLKFMNMCFQLSMVPGSWQQAIIAPIPKSSTKDPYVPLNYRGISLLSCFYKMYSSLINNRVSGYCESNWFIVDEQNGFRPDRSCIDHVYSLTAVLRNIISDKLSTYCAFIDMKKAFDWVNRDLLMYKLLTQFGLQGKLYKAIKSIYSSSSACVRVNNSCSDWFDITAGVKQGDTLSPTLFAMFLNDLATGVKGLGCGVKVDDTQICILLYADDIVLIAPDENKLQVMLNFISDWCSKWRMVVNTEKTQVVHFRPTRKTPTPFEFRFGNDTLLRVPEYKYLGVHLDEHVSFKATATALAEGAGRALGAIRYRLKFLKECRTATFTKLFSSCVCPILDYASGVWGTKQFDVLERVQERAMRYFLGVPRFTPIPMLNGDMGWSSCYTRHKLSVLRLWNRLVSLSSARVTNKILKWDLSYSSRPGSRTYFVKKLFTDMDMPFIFERQIPCDLETAYHCLRSLYQDVWDAERYLKPKLRYYNLFKPDLSQEEYLSLNIPKYQRSLFAQFRGGVLPLQVEIGRFRKIPLEERLCNLCDMGQVEDEFHFLCICTN